MKTSLFKKKITMNDAGNVLGGGDPTQREQQTIGMRHTGSWSLFWGYVSDSEYASDVETIQDVDFINMQ